MHERLGAYVQSLRPGLPRSVQTLQAGGLLNAFGNGVVFPFLFIYLNSVHDFSAGTVGLILATNGFVSLFAGPLSGSLVDRFGGRRTLTGALLVLTLGYGGYAFVTVPWQGFLASVGAGIGNGAFWPAQGALLTGLTQPHQRPVAWGMQRVMMNLGIGLGGVVGGLIASTSDPATFQALFLLDAGTFLGYAVVLLARVPEVPPARADGHAPGSYGDVLRHRVFVGVIALNAVFITFGMAQLELLPAYMTNEAGVSEKGIGLVFFVNTIVIVLAQLPVTKAAAGRRRMRLLASLGAVWAFAWLLTPVVGTLTAGVTATVLFALTQVVFGWVSACTEPCRDRSSPIWPHPACWAATWRCRPFRGSSASRSGRQWEASCSGSDHKGSGSWPRWAAYWQGQPHSCSSTRFRGRLGALPCVQPRRRPWPPSCSEPFRGAGYNAAKHGPERRASQYRCPACPASGGRGRAPSARSSHGPSGNLLSSPPTA